MNQVALFRPTTGDVAIAKARILALLRDSEDPTGYTSWPAIMERCLRDEGLWVEERGPDRNAPTARNILAAAEAVVQLIGAGTLLPAIDARVEVVRPPGLPASAGHDPATRLAVIVPHQVRRSAQAREATDYEVVFHPDVYLGGLDIPNAHYRVRQSIAEAVRSFTQESYLAAATMLGSASEGAWLEFFSSLNSWRVSRGDEPVSVSIDTLARKVLNAEGLIATDGSFKALSAALDIRQLEWKGMIVEYSYLREFRNFAAHFDRSEKFDLSYATVGGLFLRATLYFNRIYRLSAGLEREADPGEE